MLDELTAIVDFVIRGFLHLWPYLLLTIPMAVAVRMSGAARLIRSAFQAQPLVAIVLSTAVGAFSPFCSCGVIPVITALLIGGVPLAPVMSFWIASPSMDPETFFLSVATLGWDLAVWRLGTTLVLSLSAGLITHLLTTRGWLGEQLLRKQGGVPEASMGQPVGQRIAQGWRAIKERLAAYIPVARPVAPAYCCAEAAVSPAVPVPAASEPASCGCGGSPVKGSTTGVETLPAVSCGCEGSPVKASPSGEETPAAASCGCGNSSVEPSASSGETPVAASCSCSKKSAASFWKRLLSESGQAVLMVAKFMTLTLILEALITRYVPSEWVTSLLGKDNPYAVLTAALLGIPVYTGNLTALPMIGGLLAQGMNPGAALAFLIAGPTTTLPAMAAVWGIASRRVFMLYVGFVLVGAIVAGYAYSLVMG